jgi:hypothetical protein
MDAERFDRLAKAMSRPGTRRGLTRLLAALPLGVTLAALVGDRPDASAKKSKPHKSGDHGNAHRRHGRKARPRIDPGQDTKHRKRKGKGKGKNKGTTSCTKRTCSPGSCGNQSDGCGGTLSCGCPANQLCLPGGTCQPCTVSCPSGDPVACGLDLNAKMNAGGTVFVCPGTYRGGFNLLGALAAGVSVIGAGEGSDPTSNTVLDANGAGRVLLINAGVGTVVLERLRITAGNVTTGSPREPGAGIRHVGTTLQMRDCTVTGNSCTGGTGGIHSGFGPAGSTLEMTRCTVSDNHALNTGGPVPEGDGGGIFSLGTTTLTDCLIADNSANNVGGGIFHRFGSTELAGSTVVRGNSAFQGGGINVLEGTTTIGTNCRVTVNSAFPANGGGIRRAGGTVTLQGAHPSPIVVDNCHENCVGAVPGCAAGGPVGRTCPP